MQTVLSDKTSKSFERAAAQLNQRSRRQLDALERERARIHAQNVRTAANEQRKAAKARDTLEKKLRPRREAANEGLAAIIAFAKSTELEGLRAAERKLRATAGTSFLFYAAEFKGKGPFAVIELFDASIELRSGNESERSSIRVDHLALHKPFRVEDCKDGLFWGSTHDDYDTHRGEYRDYQEYIKNIAQSGCAPKPFALAFEPTDTADWDHEDVLFQVLVDCANPRTFNRYLNKALAYYKQEHAPKK